MDCQKFQENRHQVLINTKDTGRVFEQIILWGEASWWPKNCRMKFMRIGNSPVQIGTMYYQKVLLPFAPRWLALVTDISKNKSISRRFLDGLLDAEETVSISQDQDKLKLEYFMNYRIKGYLNNALWKVFFHHMHDRNIELILNNLKKYLEK